MPKEMYTGEHPEGPKLVARTRRVRYEETEEPQEGSPDSVTASQTASKIEAIHNADEEERVITP
jgi:hypothetical protein